MGYYVSIVKSDLEIPFSVQNQALAIWKLINAPEYNSLKNGGSWGGGVQKAWWYSWMEENYHETVNSCEDVLDMLGFEYEITDTGAILITGYDSKMGQEREFFVVISHLLNGGGIKWIGEDHEVFTWKFRDGMMFEDGMQVMNPFIKTVTVYQITGD